MSKGPTGPLYELQFEHFPDHLYVYAKVSRLSEESVMSYIRAVADEARVGGYRRVLIVRDIEGALPDMVNFRLSQTTIEWFKGIKTAWVNPYPDQESALKFFTDVASNRGGNYRLFADVEAARKWLLG